MKKSVGRNVDIKLSEEDYAQFVLDDIHINESRKWVRGDISILLSNPVRWRNMLGHIEAELLNELGRTEYESKFEKVADGYSTRSQALLYKTRRRIMEADRVVYWHTRDVEASTSAMLCEMIKNHFNKKQGEGDEADERLWLVLAGVAAR